MSIYQEPVVADLPAPLVPLTQGFSAIVDPEDYERIMAHKWMVDIRPNGRKYARRVSDRGRVKHYLHREVLNTPLEVDHINGDGLDNRRSNLRAATHRQNLSNFTKPVRKAGSTSRYKGVSRRPGTSKWVARIHVNYKGRNLGSFETEEAAARAYDAAARETWGEFAKVNFP